MNDTKAERAAANLHDALAEAIRRLHMQAPQALTFDLMAVLENTDAKQPWRDGGVTAEQLEQAVRDSVYRVNPDSPVPAVHLRCPNCGRDLYHVNGEYRCTDCRYLFTDQNPIEILAVAVWHALVNVWGKPEA